MALCLLFRLAENLEEFSSASYLNVPHKSESNEPSRNLIADARRTPENTVCVTTKHACKCLRPSSCLVVVQYTYVLLVDTYVSWHSD